MARLRKATQGLSLSSREPDLDRLPIETTTSGKVVGIFLMLFASVWGGIPTYAILTEWDSMGEEGFIVLLFPIIGLGMFLFGAYSLFSRRVLTIGADRIGLEQKSLFGRNAWEEPLRRYRGALLKTVRVRRNKSTVTAYAVLLTHDDDDKTVPLYVGRERADARRVWEAAAKRFDLTAMEETVDGTFVRRAEDLDKSVRALAAEGKLEVEFEARPPPPAFTARYEGDTLVVTTAGPTVPGKAALAIALAPLVILFWFGLFGAIIELAIVGWLLFDRYVQQRLRIGRDGVEMQWCGRWGVSPPKRIEADRIEAVDVARPSGKRAALDIVSDRTTLHFGRGRPVEALAWAREAVLVHVAAA